MENNLYPFHITKESSVSLKFQQTREDFKELEFISFSPKMSPFRIFVSDKETATSENSIQIIPSWIGGYYASVTKSSRYYCTKCNFTIFIEPEFDEADLFFLIKYEDSVSRIFPHHPIMSSLKPYQKHCYNFTVHERFKNEEIIIQTELFSGSATMKYNPWTLPNETDKFFLEKEITGEDVSIIKPTERNINGTTVGSNYICLKSYDYTSYLLRVYFPSQSHYLQRFNFLFNGVSITGYLPAETVTKYRATEFTYSSDIFFNMKVISGNPQIYGYVCSQVKECFFTKEKINELSKIEFLFKIKKMT